MRVTLLHASTAAAVGLVLATTATAAQVGPAHLHIGHVAHTFTETPRGLGLLPTAVAEAGVVAQHVEFAAQDPSDLEALKRHVLHVLHAVDPTLVGTGPGLGYGLRRAAEGAARHAEMAGSAQGASENVRTHALHVTASANSALARADAIVALGQQIQAANSVAEAWALLQRLAAESHALLAGRDGNRDGLVGWESGEGGLRQATQHMTLMRRGEGLLN
jgi:hypothetical protein